MKATYFKSALEELLITVRAWRLYPKEFLYHSLTSSDKMLKLS